MNEVQEALRCAVMALDHVECRGRQNHDFLLYAIQRVEYAMDVLKEGEADDADNEQG